jgi:branched-chain amino acid transport system substrate-binding protein
MAGLPLALVRAGAANVGVTGTEGFESSAIVDSVIDQGITASGATKVGDTVYVPFNAPDMSSQVSQVASGDVQGVVLPLWATDIARFLVTARQLGVEATFAAPSASVSPSVIDELGDSAEGLLLVGSFPPVSDDSAGMSAFRDDMEAHAPDAAVNEISLNGWLAVQIVAAEAESLATVDAASLLAALNAATSLDTAGVLPPISFTAPGSMPGMTRLVNTKVYLSKVQDGTATLTEPDPVDPFAP